MAMAYDRQQVTTVAQYGSHRMDRPQPTVERTFRIIGRIGQSLNLAIERFATVCETLADDSPHFKKDMFDNCKEARTEAASLESLCDIMANNTLDVYDTLEDRSTMIQVSQDLLTTVTRIVVIADAVVCDHFLIAKNKTPKAFSKLEAVAHYTEFVRAYSLYGTEMIELANLICNRHNESGEERRRSQMAVARQNLERHIGALLVSTKANLRHPDCIHINENRDSAFCEMRRAIDLIHFVVKDGFTMASRIVRDRYSRYYTHPWDGRGTASNCLRIFARTMEYSRPKQTVRKMAALKDISSLQDDDFVGERRELMRSNSERDRHMVNHHRYKNRKTAYRDSPEYHGSSNGFRYGSSSEMTRHSRVRVGFSILEPHIRDQLLQALNTCIEKTQNFTDSAYTTHEHRENILLLCDRMRLELNQCLRIAVNMEQFPNSRFDIDAAIDSVLNAAQDLSQQLALAVADQIPELNQMLKTCIELVNSLRNIALDQELDRFQETSDRFHDYIDHILEICKLLRHIALTEAHQVQARFAELNLKVYASQVLTAAKGLSTCSKSKIVKDNLDVFSGMWNSLACDITSLSKEALEVTQAISKSDRSEYLSLPRPGKHGTTSKPLKALHFDDDEKDRMAEAGMDMKMSGSEMDADADKWDGANEENNDILKKAKVLSTLAESMSQFTKGEGTLRTTQDLFTQAEYFAEEANSLYKTTRQFSYQVPASDSKKTLLDLLDVVPTFVQSLQFTVKDPTVGKAATFVKVDHVIRETKNLMDAINKVVTQCFACAKEHKLDFKGISGKSQTSGLRDEDSGSGAAGDSKGSSTSTEASM